MLWAASPAKLRPALHSALAAITHLLPCLQAGLPHGRRPSATATASSRAAPGSPMASAGSEADDGSSWEPGAYGLYDVKPKKASPGRRIATDMLSSAARRAASDAAAPCTPRARKEAAAPPAARPLHRPVSPSAPGFPFASFRPSADGTPPVLHLFPGQLRAQTSSKKAAAAGLAVLVKRQDSAGSRDRCAGMDRADSAGFGSELSWKGDE